MTSGEEQLRPETAVVALAIALGLGWPSARADGLHGRLELQEVAAFARGASIDSALGAENRNDLLANFRLTWETSRDRWSFSFHYVLTLQNGDSVRLVRAEAGLLPAVPSTWFNLSETFVDHAQVTATQRIDRLSLTYTTPHLVVRVGRQSLSWGSGLVFRPMDLFDPFSPSAIDSEYKPGVEMLYAQWLFADGSDLQLIVVPRPARKGAQPAANASSVALHLHTSTMGHRVTWLVARDHGDWMAALGVNGSFRDTTWNLELVPTLVRGGTLRVSALANISDALTVFDRNATVFAEYFHNGFGVDGSNFDLAELPDDLTDRLARGQVFNTRRDYLAAGLSIEVNPLLALGSTLIAGISDASMFALLSGTYSISDNLSLIAGAQLPIGPARTEFGGLPLDASSPVMLAPPRQVYTQLRQYF